MLTDFLNPCTDRFRGKFTTKSFLNIPPHLKGVATLPCEILRSENIQCIVISEKIQGSVAAR